MTIALPDGTSWPHASFLRVAVMSLIQGGDLHAQGGQRCGVGLCGDCSRQSLI